MNSRSTPPPRPLSLLVEVPFSERPGPAFSDGISLPMTCEEWMTIRDALRQRAAQEIVALVERVHDEYADTVEDGIVFCGKCGHAKDGT